jgi:hypothetical protein
MDIHRFIASPFHGWMKKMGTIRNARPHTQNRNPVAKLAEKAAQLRRMFNTG